MRAYIDQIEAGHKKRKLFGFTIKEVKDTLCISNKPDAWLINLFNGYEQIGKFEVDNPWEFMEGEWVDVTLNKEGKIIAVNKLKDE